MRFAKNYPNSFTLIEDTACQTWLVLRHSVYIGIHNKQNISRRIDQRDIEIHNTVSSSVGYAQKLNH